MTDLEKEWKEMSVRVDSFTDKLEYPVDKGIKDTVIVLNLLGFETSASCEGHIDEDRNLGPYVDIDPMDSEKDFAIIFKDSPGTNSFNEARERVDTKLAHILEDMILLVEEFYKNREVRDRSRLIVSGYNWIRIHNQGSDILQIHSDNHNLLKDFQTEMNNFTAFLKNKYFSK